LTTCCMKLNGRKPSFLRKFGLHQHIIANHKTER